MTTLPVGADGKPAKKGSSGTDKGPFTRPLEEPPTTTGAPATDEGDGTTT